MFKIRVSCGQCSETLNWVNLMEAIPLFRLIKKCRPVKVAVQNLLICANSVRSLRASKNWSEGHIWFSDHTLVIGYRPTSLTVVLRCYKLWTVLPTVKQLQIRSVFIQPFSFFRPPWPACSKSFLCRYKTQDLSLTHTSISDLAL